MSTPRKRRILAEELPIDPEEMTEDDEVMIPIQKRSRGVGSHDGLGISKKRRGGVVLRTALLFIFLGIVAWFVSDYYAMTKEIRILKDPAEQARLAEEESRKIIAQIAQVMILPTDEAPTLLTIKDAATLASQEPFYSGTVNGDVVVVYEKAAKAIVWSPSRYKIVNVGPVYREDEAQSTGGANSSSNTSSSTAKASSKASPSSSTNTSSKSSTEETQ